jgi:hypothetical protein
VSLDRFGQAHRRQARCSYRAVAADGAVPADQNPAAASVHRRPPARAPTTAAARKGDPINGDDDSLPGD